MFTQRVVINVSSVSLADWCPRCLSGRATVVDGDTIIIDGERVRLHGIDAPELGQTFWCRGREFDCGAMAAAALEALIADIKLRCEPIERDCYGRLVAKCFSRSGVDVCRRLVASGWVLAFRRYSLDYVPDEIKAKEAFRGLWRGTFDKPWEWRQSKTAAHKAEVTPRPAPNS
jgi:endonuclease YncB( thermonuclease family)